MMPVGMGTDSEHLSHFVSPSILWKATIDMEEISALAITTWPL
jgi:hypothetical protein